MTDVLEIKLREIIEALNGESGVTPPPGTEDRLKWYLDEIISILKGNGGDSYLGVFVREFNGLTGIGASADASGNPPAASGQEGDHWFTLAFNSAVSDGLPAGWIIIPWMYTGGAWEFSSLLLPIAAKDLHWVAVANGSDINGYYVILSGTEETDPPKWELLGAAAVVPDGKTIGYNSNGELEAKPFARVLTAPVDNTATDDDLLSAKNTYNNILGDKVENLDSGFTVKKIIAALNQLIRGNVAALTWSDYFTPVNGNIQVQSGAAMYRSGGEARLRIPFKNVGNEFTANTGVFNPVAGKITTPNIGTFYGVLYGASGGLFGTCWIQEVNNVLMITPLPGTTIAAGTGLVIDIRFPL
jgi:hypothetical protein